MALKGEKAKNSVKIVKNAEFQSVHISSTTTLRAGWAHEEAVAFGDLQCALKRENVICKCLISSQLEALR